MELELEPGGGSPQQQGGGVTVPFNDEDSRTYNSSEEIDH
jgi:hypothetical protein